MISQKISHINDMKNAKEEFLRVTLLHKEFNKVKCAQITHECGMDKYHTYSLRVGYTQEEYDKFVDSLDFEYDAGHGEQELFGYIWIKDGTWYEREEYDGSEWWEYKSTPPIPDELIN